MPAPPQRTPLESIQTEVSRLLQGVIPVLEALHTFPFHNRWLKDSPGDEYVNLMQQIEKWLLWLWEQVQNHPPASLPQAVLVWESQQTRQHEGVLAHYYRFYEALAVWSQNGVENALKKTGWSGYIGFILTQESHLLAKRWAGTAPPQREERTLIAQHYLKQMQQVHDLDPHLLCVDFFILMGVFTQKSYFIPHLTFPPLEQPSPAEQFFETLKNAKSWSAQANPYLEWLQAHPPQN